MKPGNIFSCAAAVASLSFALCACAVPLVAGDARAAEPAAQRPQPTYADLATLADQAPLVVRATVTRQAALEPERAPGLAAGWTRLYLEAETGSLLTGTVPIGESLRYLADVPLDAKGKAPKLKKASVLLFARPVAGRPGELQLVRPDAQLPWDEGVATRLRAILTEMVAADAAPAITGVRDALSIEGNLAGESETQIFLATPSGDPVSITIERRPGMEPRWGVSYSEIVDQSARPPQQDTLAWYRLACALPASLPTAANLSQDSTARARAATDYAFVIAQLGPCSRNLTR